MWKKKCRLKENQWRNKFDVKISTRLNRKQPCDRVSERENGCAWSIEKLIKMRKMMTLSPSVKYWVNEHYSALDILSHSLKRWIQRRQWCTVYNSIPQSSVCVCMYVHIVFPYSNVFATASNTETERENQTKALQKTWDA